MAKYVCQVCGYVYEGDAAPAECPICHAPASKFTKQEEGKTWAAEHVVGVGKTFGASYFTVFWKVGIPSSLTMTFAGIKVAIGNAWATLVAAEMLAASSGLGYMILMGRSYARVDLIILGIVVIGVLGVLISAIINWVERILLGWRYV